jgi:hypothetical protein
MAKWEAMQEYIAGPLLWEKTLLPQRDHIICQRNINKPQTKVTN